MARRTELPRLCDGWLELPGEPPSRVDPRDHDPERRVYEELLRDDELAVWLICWIDDHGTGFHAHAA